jgi:hypothetical protein
MSSNGTGKRIIGSIVVLGFLTCIFLTILVGRENSQETAWFLVGVLAGQFSSVIKYYFGNGRTTQ